MANKMILVMGLSGSGKTSFAKMIVKEFHEREIPVTWFNDDEIRHEFELEDNIVLAKQIRELADESKTEYNVIDACGCTLKERVLLNADYAIWLDTIEDSEHEFTRPDLSYLMMKLPTWATPREAISVVNMVTGQYK